MLEEIVEQLDRPEVESISLLPVRCRPDSVYGVTVMVKIANGPHLLYTVEEVDAVFFTEEYIVDRLIVPALKPAIEAAVEALPSMKEKS